MTFPWANGLRRTAIAAGVIGYPVLAHYSSTSPAAANPPSLGVAVALAPTVAFLLWLSWRSLPRPAMLGLSLSMGGLLWAAWPSLEQNFNWLYYLQHAGTNALLAMAFGATLAPGRQPLISRLAESLRGDLPAAVARYTRQVTLAWTVFFIAIALISSALFFFASIATW